MSGYEKSPDYGAPPTSPLYIRLGALAILAVAALIVWNMFPAAPLDCVEISAADVETIEMDGWTLSVLRLDKVPTDRCIRIAPPRAP